VCADGRRWRSRKISFGLDDISTTVTSEHSNGSAKTRLAAAASTAVVCCLKPTIALAHTSSLQCAIQQDVYPYSFVMVQSGGGFSEVADYSIKLI